jgi:DNA-binding GntR family transcriptional regulator
MSAEPSGRGVRRRSLADEVTEALLSQLLDGELPAGEPVRIDTVARELEVSATPVREALARLEHSGLVERTAMRGYRVTPQPSREELVLLVDARLVIEPVNAARACARADPALLSALRSCLERQASAPTGPDFVNYRDYFVADRAFHDLINDHGGNPYLSNAFRSLNGLIQRFRLFHRHVVDDAEHTVAEHRAVLEAFEGGDPDAAAEAMRRHLHRLLDSLGGSPF